MSLFAAQSGAGSVTHAATASTAHVPTFITDAAEALLSTEGQALQQPQEYTFYATHAAAASHPLCTAHSDSCLSADRYSESVAVSTAIA
jgi:hypothetical protein